MTISTEFMRRVDAHWASHLGCAAEQLRDGGRHIVARPGSGDGTLPPWPLRRGPVALVTTGAGWVLSLPEERMERAEALCASLDFGEIVAEGDRLSQGWFDGGAHENPAVKRSETDAAYGTMNRLVS
ncbi:MAG: hypothetical protein ACYTHM_20275, partial [Planctomycetota bacterium]